MATKILAVREDIHRILQEMKDENESFNEVIKRLIKGKGSFLRFFDSLKESPFLDEIKEDIMKNRKQTVLRI